MKVLVTGATGFVGSHIVSQLSDAGCEAVVLYRSEQKLSLLAGSRYEAVPGDLLDRAALARACAGCDIVIHTAAKAADVRRVIFTSSASAIGIRPGEEAADESEAYNLPPERFWYAYTKVKAEAVVAEFVAEGLDVVTLNPAVIIGPGDVNAISGSFILETARYQWLTPVSSGGLAVIDVRDVARAHLKAIARGRSGERYILSTANLSYREWFRLIAGACAVRPPPFALPDWMLEPTARLIELLRALGVQTPMDANQTRLGGSHVYFDGSKARRELFRPEIDVETSLRDTYDWYRQNGYIKRDLLSRLIGLI